MYTKNTLIKAAHKAAVVRATGSPYMFEEYWADCIAPYPQDRMGTSDEHLEATVADFTSYVDNMCPEEYSAAEFRRWSDTVIICSPAILKDFIREQELEYWAGGGITLEDWICYWAEYEDYHMGPYGSSFGPISGFHSRG